MKPMHFLRFVGHFIVRFLAFGALFSQLTCAQGDVLATLRGQALIAQVNANFYNLHALISQEGQTGNENYTLCLLAYNDKAMDLYAKGGALDCSTSLSGDFLKIQIRFRTFQNGLLDIVHNILDKSTGQPTGQLLIGVSLELGSKAAGMQQTYKADATDGQVLINSINIDQTTKAVNYIDLQVRTIFYSGTNKDAELAGTVIGAIKYPTPARLPPAPAQPRR